jgi:methyl-accepting chemotaxis protein
LKTKKTLKNKESSFISEEVDSLITAKLTLGPGVSSAIENLFVLDSSEASVNEQMNELQTKTIKWRQRSKYVKLFSYTGIVLVLLGIAFCAFLSLASTNTPSNDGNTIIYNSLSRSLYQELTEGGDDGFNQLVTTIGSLPSNSPANKQEALSDISGIQQKWKYLNQVALNINNVLSSADSIQTSLQTAFPYVTWNPYGLKNVAIDLSATTNGIIQVVNGKTMDNNIIESRNALMGELYAWAKNAPSDKGWITAWNSLSQINKPLEDISNSGKDWDNASLLWDKLKTDLSPVLTSSVPQTSSVNNWIGLFLIFVGFAFLAIALYVQTKTSKINEELVTSTNERVANVIAGIMSQLNMALHGDLSNLDEIDEKNANTLKGKINFMIVDLAAIVTEIKRFVSKTQDVTNDAKKNANILADHNIDQTNRMSEMSRQIIELLDGLDSVESETNVLKKSIENAVATTNLTVQDSEKALSGLQSIQTDFDELKTRVKRLLSYNTEFSELGGWIQDIGDRLEVLAIQAQSQSVKNSGATNEGFKVVAEDIHALRKQAEEKAEKMVSILKMTQTDSDTVRIYLDNTLKSLSEVSSVVELKNESSKKIEGLISDMNGFIAVVSKTITSQEKTMSELKASSTIVTKIGEDDKEAVNNALTSFNTVTEIVRVLVHKIQKFKVKS